MHGFDFSSAMRRVCDDMTRRLPELGHIEMARVAVGFRQVRKNVSHGLQASLTPMRFDGGSREGVRNGRKYAVEKRLASDGREYLYLLNFYVPRFLDHPLHEKLVTILHELLHVSPDFDGDLRRHDGRYYVHGPSEHSYDTMAKQLAQNWLALDPPHHIYEFLDRTFSELVKEYGGVYGRQFRTPRLVPVES